MWRCGRCLQLPQCLRLKPLRGWLLLRNDQRWQPQCCHVRSKHRLPPHLRLWNHAHWQRRLCKVRRCGRCLQHFECVRLQPLRWRVLLRQRLIPTGSHLRRWHWRCADMRCWLRGSGQRVHPRARWRAVHDRQHMPDQQLRGRLLLRNAQRWQPQCCHVRSKHRLPPHLRRWHHAHWQRRLCKVRRCGRCLHQPKRLRLQPLRKRHLLRQQRLPPALSLRCRHWPRGSLRHWLRAVWHGGRRCVHPAARGRSLQQQQRLHQWQVPGRLLLPVLQPQQLPCCSLRVWHGLCVLLHWLKCACHPGHARGGLLQPPLPRLHWRALQR